MSYKTILAHVDESEHARERIKLAATVAMAESAHLIGTAMTGASRYIQRTKMLAEIDPNFMIHVALLRKRANRGLEEFEITAQKLGVSSFEKRLVDDEAGGGICLQARYCDLIVIGQTDPTEPSPVVMPDFPQYVVINSGRPVLIVPYAGQFETVGNRILVAWDASMAATRSVTNAIPFLKRAQIVEVAVFNADAPGQAHAALPGSDIALYLARHHIKVEVQLHKTDNDIGDALVSLVTDLNSDLLVMGGYGHSRFREILLGGVTRTVLETMTVPVLMSH